MEGLHFSIKELLESSSGEQANPMKGCTFRAKEGLKCGRVTFFYIWPSEGLSKRRCRQDGRQEALKIVLGGLRSRKK